MFNSLTIIKTNNKIRKIYPLGIHCNARGAFSTQNNINIYNKLGVYISKRFVGGKPKLPKGTSNLISKNPTPVGGSNLSKPFSGSSAAKNSNDAQVSSTNNSTSPGSNETADKNIATSSQEFSKNSSNNNASSRRYTENLPPGRRKLSDWLPSKDSPPNPPYIPLLPPVTTVPPVTPYIPPAPPLPPKPETQIHPESKPLLDQLIEKKKNLININGKPYTTDITKETQVQDISCNNLIEEMKQRGLVKEDDGKTVCTILDRDNNAVVVGESAQKVKFTPLGQAYFKEVQQDTLQTSFSTNIADIKNPKFLIVFPPKAGNVFVELGEFKHLLVGFHGETNKYFAMGFLTSKKSLDKVSNTQYKTFENQQEGFQNVSENQKPQHFSPFNNLIFLEAKDINPVKYSQEYLNSLGEELRVFSNIFNTLKKMPVIPFNVNGLTKEDALNLCKMHDKHVIEKKSHPLTKDQLKQQELAKEKEKEKQKLLFEEKQKKAAQAKIEGLKKQQELKSSKTKTYEENS